VIHYYGFILTGSWTSAPGSFLFSLRNHDDLDPFKAQLKNEGNVMAIYRDSGYGPCFGFDFCIVNNAGKTAYSYTNFGWMFQPPPGYILQHPNTQSLLAGSYHFTPAEVEVLFIN
jgi:hypothetical protein